MSLTDSVRLTTDEPTEVAVRPTDPREMSKGDLSALGMTRVARGDAIRTYCVEVCMCGARSAVLECGSGGCPLWPFRMGNDPWRDKREMSEDERVAAGDRLRAVREARRQE